MPKGLAHENIIMLHHWPRAAAHRRGSARSPPQPPSERAAALRAPPAHCPRALPCPSASPQTPVRHVSKHACLSELLSSCARKAKLLCNSSRCCQDAQHIICHWTERKPDGRWLSQVTTACLAAQQDLDGVTGCFAARSRVVAATSHLEEGSQRQCKVPTSAQHCQHRREQLC